MSPLNYGSFDCQQIAAGSQRLQQRVSTLHGSLKQEAKADAWKMGVGLVLFWPTLFFLEDGDGPEAAEYAHLKGKAEALQKAAVEKRCTAAPTTRQAAGSPPTAPEPIASTSAL